MSSVVTEKVSERFLVIGLRSIGKSYEEINQILGHIIPKSTMSNWCRSAKMPDEYYKRIEDQNKQHLESIREKSIEIRAERKKQYLKEIRTKYSHIRKLLENDENIGKLALSMIYLGEGKKGGSSLILGNSNAQFISLYLYLLRKCYQVDENKFRCTVQCRNDQNINDLEKYWSGVTDIPLAQFYKARIDARSIGLPTKKKDYRGVCRIDYFSSKIFYEIMEIGNVCLNNK